MTDLILPALDAYRTAKPNEPTWTVQGGDPLGGALLRIWAAFARIQAGVITGGAVDGIFHQILEAANKHPPANDRERDGLLIRATQTEFISFDMDAYRRGSLVAEESETTAENSADEMERIDLHDARVRAVQKINNMVAELTDMFEDFQRRDFQTGDANAMLMPFNNQGGQLKMLIYELKRMSKWLEPRRLMKQS